MPSFRFIAVHVLAARSAKLFIALHCNSGDFTEVLQRFCSAREYKYRTHSASRTAKANGAPANAKRGIRVQ